MAQELGQATLMDNRVGEKAPYQAHNLDITARVHPRDIPVEANEMLALRIIGIDQTKDGETSGHEMVAVVDTQDNNSVCHSPLLEKAEEWEA